MSYHWEILLFSFKLFSCSSCSSWPSRARRWWRRSRGRCRTRWRRGWCWRPPCPSSPPQQERPLGSQGSRTPASRASRIHNTCSWFAITSTSMLLEDNTNSSTSMLLEDATTLSTSTSLNCCCSILTTTCAWVLLLIQVYFSSLVDDCIFHPGLQGFLFSPLLHSTWQIVMSMYALHTMQGKARLNWVGSMKFRSVYRVSWMQLSSALQHCNIYVKGNLLFTMYCRTALSFAVYTVHYHDL